MAPASPPRCPPGQALEDTMRRLWSLKQLFLFTCCLLRRCFAKISCFSWEKKKKIPLLEAYEIRKP